MNIDGYHLGPQAKKSSLIILLGLIIICIILLNFVLEIKNKKEENNIIKEIITEENKEKDITKTIISQKLYMLDIFNQTFTDFTNIPNQTKLQLGILPYKEEGFTPKELKNYLTDTYGSKLQVFDEDIPSINASGYIYKFNDDNYILSSGSVNDLIYSEFNHVINFEEQYGHYTLTVTKMFYNHDEKLDSFYMNFDDCKNKQNALFTLNDVEQSLQKEVTNTTEIWEYYIKNIKNINEYTKYKYTFGTDNNHYVLLKYEIL